MPATSCRFNLEHLQWDEQLCNECVSVPRLTACEFTRPCRGIKKGYPSP